MPISSAVSAGLALLNVAIFARALDLSSMGFALATTSGILIAVDAFDFGSSRHLALELARGSIRGSNDFLGYLVLRLYFGGAILITAVIADRIYSTSFLFPAALLLISRLFILVLTSVLQGLSQFLEFAATAVADKMLTVIAGVALLTAGGTAGANTFILAQAIGTLMAATIGLVFALRATGFERPRLPGLPWSTAPSLGFANLVTDASVLDVPIVTHFSTAAQAASFALPARIVGPIGMISVAYSAVVMPRLASAQTDSQAKKALLHSVRFIGPGLAVGLISVAIAAEPAMILLGGDQYASSAGILRIYCLSAFLSSGSVLLLTHLQARREARFATACLITTSSWNVLALVAGSISLGAIGAALAFLSTNVFLFVLLLMRTVKNRSLSGAS